jgi:hypothetical protein
MSLTIKEIEGGKRNVDIQSGITSTRLFKIIATAGETKKQALDGLGIALLDADPEDSNLKCKSLDATRQKSNPNNILYLATVNYTSIANELIGVGAGADPLEADSVYTLTFNSRTVALDKFADGTPILNSAKDFIQGLEKTCSFAVMQVSRNEASYALSEALLYVDHVNSDTFYGITAGNAYCRAINAQTKAKPDGSGIYYAVTYEIELNLNPDFPAFKLKVLDRGKRKLVSGKQTAIKDKDGGKDITEPVLLNGSGLPLDPPTGDPSWIEGDIYPSVAFSGMSL